MSQLGNNAASALVELNTLGLVAEADNIVSNCTGPNCNVSESTRATITQNLSKVAQIQASGTLLTFFISSSSAMEKHP